MTKTQLMRTRSNNNAQTTTATEQRYTEPETDVVAIIIYGRRCVRERCACVRTRCACEMKPQGTLTLVDREPGALVEREPGALNTLQGTRCPCSERKRARQEIYPGVLHQ
jgi:hypothetical protein